MIADCHMKIKLLNIAVLEEYDILYNQLSKNLQLRSCLLFCIYIYNKKKILYYRTRLKGIVSLLFQSILSTQYAINDICDYGTGSDNSGRHSVSDRGYTATRAVQRVRIGNRVPSDFALAAGLCRRARLQARLHHMVSRGWLLRVDQSARHTLRRHLSQSSTIIINF